MFYSCKKCGDQIHRFLHGLSAEHGLSCSCTRTRIYVSCLPCSASDLCSGGRGEGAAALPAAADEVTRRRVDPHASTYEAYRIVGRS